MYIKLNMLLYMIYIHNSVNFYITDYDKNQVGSLDGFRLTMTKK